MATPPRPTPRAMRGSTDPAKTVRPVDWTAHRRPAQNGGADGEARAGDGAAAVGGEGRTAAGRPAPGGRSGPTPGPRRRPQTVELDRPLPAPPEDAVLSVTEDSPRPLPRPLRLREEEIRAVGVREVIPEQVIHAVADPEDAWTADAGTSDHFRRGGIVVQVRRADNAVIGVFSSGYALSVRPETYEPALDIAEDAAGPSARGGRGTRHPTTRTELLRRLEEAGFVVTPGAGHGKVSHPDHPGLFVPFASTPSDRRFTRHAVAQIRRVFGIDLRR